MSPKRRTLSVEIKMDVLRRIDAGEKIMRISSAMKLPKSTIQTINKNREKIKEQLAAATPSNISRLTRKRNSLLEGTEKLLSKWVEDNLQQKIPLSRKIIQEKAKSIFETLSRGAGGVPLDDLSFKASRGWFEKFKRRNNLSDAQLRMEANTDMEPNEDNANILKHTIERGNYAPSQVFNFIQVELHWKFKEFQGPTQESPSNQTNPTEWFTVLLVSSATGDFQFKPLVITYPETQNLQNGINKKVSTIISRSFKKPWTTQAAFKNWFRDCFLQDVEKYLESKNISSKVLILLNFSSTDLTTPTASLRVNFMQKSSTIVDQLRDQEIISSFKSNYLRKTFQSLSKKSQNSRDMRNVWKKYNIEDAIEIVNNSWNDVKSYTFSNLWESNIVNMDVEQSTDVGREELIELANEIGLEAYLENDDELLEISRELLPLRTTRSEPNKLSKMTTLERTSMNNMKKALQYFEKGLTILQKCDSNKERTKRVHHDVNKAILCYKRLFENAQM